MINQERFWHSYLKWDGYHSLTQSNPVTVHFPGWDLSLLTKAVARTLRQFWFTWYVSPVGELSEGIDPHTEVWLTRKGIDICCEWYEKRVIGIPDRWPPMFSAVCAWRDYGLGAKRWHLSLIVHICMTLELYSAGRAKDPWQKVLDTDLTEVLAPRECISRSISTLRDSSARISAFGLLPRQSRILRFSGVWFVENQTNRVTKSHCHTSHSIWIDLEAFK